MTFATLLTFLAGTLLPSLLASWVAALVLRRWAPRWGLVDQPGHRKVHLEPTPLGGGIAIWLAVVGSFAAALVVVWLAGPDTRLVPAEFRPHLDGVRAQTGPLVVLLAAGTLLMLLGLADDCRGVDWRLRLAVQVAVAAVCVEWGDWRLTAFIEVPVLTSVLSVLWVVTLINAFNMLDNMDGLSAGIAAIAAGMLAAVLLLNPQPVGGEPQLFVAGFLLVLVGALLGFLWHNRPPARIFMGDAGSYFVGFSIAIATMLATYVEQSGTAPHAILAPLCVMAVPLYDLTTVVWIRLREGRSPFVGDKSHFSHRLVELGMSKGQAVLTIYLTTATCAFGALLLHRVTLFGAGVIVLQIVCVLTLIAILESSARRRPSRPRT